MGWLAGVVILFLGLMVSIALHELGHFSFAKLFGVRTTQFMVGFGPTLWSKTKGETEYGLKWIPVGGYIRMIGMLPPRKGDAPGQLRPYSTGRFSGLIDSARGQALEEVGPDDGDRVFYAKKWWQKLIIMFAGPAVNLVLAVFFFAILIMGIGSPTLQPQIASISKCVVPAGQQVGDTCPAKAPPTPAVQAGLQPGDKIISFGGKKIDDYATLQRLIRDSGGKTVPTVVQRGGKQVPVQIPVISNQMPDLDNPDKTVNVGFIGISPTEAYERQGPGAVVSTITDLTGRTAASLVKFPQKMVGVWQAAFTDKERDPEGPVGVVGVSRMGGDIAASKKFTETQKIATFVGLLGSVNLALGLFNLIPLLPLDGGHIFGALWEAVKKGFAKILRRPDPGYVDVAKALPLTYAMAVVLIVMGGLLVYADLVNPIQFPG